MTPRCSLVSGGAGELESLDDERVVLHSSEPAPPGATLIARFDEIDEALQIKVKSCRHDSALGTYRVEGRAVNVSRALRRSLTGS